MHFKTDYEAFSNETHSYIVLVERAEGIMNSHRSNSGMHSTDTPTKGLLLPRIL
jgi:hypothetical protein